LIRLAENVILALSYDILTTHVPSPIVDWVYENCNVLSPTFQVLEPSCIVPLPVDPPIHHIHARALSTKVLSLSDIVDAETDALSRSSSEQLAFFGKMTRVLDQILDASRMMA
jgi:hypothetical protein